MASIQLDALALLRSAIAKSLPLTLSSGPDLNDSGSPASSIADASFLTFPQPGTKELVAVPLDSTTRFVTNQSGAISLRSIYYAWVNRDLSIPEYIQQCEQLNLQRLNFVERTDLIAFLEGAESEYIVGTLPELDKVTELGTIRPGATHIKESNPRLLEIYSQERSFGDKYAMLHGLRATDFTYVRKMVEPFLPRSKPKENLEPSITNAPIHPSRLGQIPRPNPSSNSPSVPSGSGSRSGRPKDPIILLSPSTSSIIRMSNVKSLLESGVFVPPSHSAGSDTSILHISRTLRSIHPTNQIRFIIVDTTEQFKPDYWDRVVAVFTTGQSWQFKQYKWVEPQQLFSKVKGFYVGYEKEAIPKEVKAWGGVQIVGVDKERRWRDREVVEIIWEGIEQFMVRKGWGRS